MINLVPMWDISIYRGILTGFNAAFIIDNHTKEALVAEDPNSAEILKPILRGRDIKRYRAQWAKMWLIDAHNGYEDIPPINIQDFPAVKTHLDYLYPQLINRHDKGETPYNLRSCAYYKEFMRDKIVWIELVENGRFAYDDSGMYCEATTFIMTGVTPKYLCTLLNSKLIRWFLQQVAPTSGMGTLRWKKVYVETIPIPFISATKQQPFITLADEIIASLARFKNTISKETEIDQLVYALYGLTDEEIRVVETN